MEKITIAVDRFSVCAADDMNSHNINFEFDLDSTILEVVEQIESHKKYGFYGGGIWAGKYDDYKTIRTNKGIWSIDKNELAHKVLKNRKSNYV